MDIELTQGVRRALPIAVLPFDGQATQEQSLDTLIGRNLQNSGRFSLVEGSSLTTDIDYGYWLKQGANYLVVGRVQPLEDGRQLVSVRLVDPVGQQQLLLNQQFRVQPNNMRHLAHHISDLIYEQLMGEKGIFSTRIAYINAQHDANRYILEVADFDGYSPKPLLTSSEPIMSPVWSPDGKEIAYVTFENKQAEVHIVNVASGQRRPITQYPGINGAPAWSPDGKKLAVVLSKDGSPSIYQINLANNQLTRLTHGDYIDTEPSWSPDGQSLLFTSDRGGSPQIYRLNLADNTVERVTFRGDYNARASYTPDGRDIVLLHRTRNGQFNIATQDVQHGVINVLTKTGSNESPSLAPNGKMIIFATREQGQGALRITSLDGQVQLRLPARSGDVQEPAWSPLLNPGA